MQHFAAPNNNSQRNAIPDQRPLDADRLNEIFAPFIVSSLRKTRQQGIWAGGVPMHYSNAAAAALE